MGHYSRLVGNKQKSVRYTMYTVNQYTTEKSLASQKKMDLVKYKSHILGWVKGVPNKA